MLSERHNFFENSKKLIIIILVSLIIQGVIFALVTRYGLGVAPDSITYIETAKLLVEETSSLTGSPNVGNFFPLGYSYLLAAVTWLGMGLSGLRWVQLIQSLMLLAVFFIITWKLTGGDTLVVGAVSVLILFSWPFLGITSKILSELSFILVVMFSVLFVLLFLEKSKWYWLILAGFCLGLGYVFRYAGISFLPIFLLFVVLHLLLRKRSHWGYFGIITVATLIFPIINSFRNYLVTDSATGRFFLINTTTLYKLTALPFTMFLMPGNIEVGVVNLAVNLFFLGLIGLYIKNIVKQRNFEKPQTQIILYLFTLGIGYLVVVVLTIFFFDPSTPINNRILLPARFLFLIPSLVSLRSFVATIGSSKRIYPIVIMTLLLLGAFEFVPSFIDTVQNGAGYASRRWNGDEMVKKALTIQGKTVYTNGLDVMSYFSPDFPAMPLPNVKYRVSRLSNPNYKDEIGQVCQEVLKGNAVIVFFYELEWRAYLFTEEEIIKTCPGMEVSEMPSGVIFGSLK